MNLYIVRHGQSVANEEKKFQGTDGPLSKQGIKQAEILAKRFSSIPVDVIILSPYKRAEQTADIIGRALGKEVIISALLRERKKPFEIVGKKNSDLKAGKIWKLIKEHNTNPAWHYSDEESFLMPKKE